MQNAEKIRWLATVWTFLLVAAFLFYVFRAWRKGKISLFGRSGELVFSRELDPILFWLMMGFHGAILGGLLLILCIRFYTVIERATH
jgi:heme/copper-type cytochrome/quinol oxidase subunit 3